jgi:hypothetical protein
MTNWIEHNGGPQPVADDVWVEVSQLYRADDRDLARWIAWDYKLRYRILNEHLTRAALKRGIELGLEAAAEKIAEKQDHDLREILNIDPEAIAREAQHD